MPELSRPAAPPSCVADYVTATDPSASSEAGAWIRVKASSLRDRQLRRARRPT